MVCAMPAATRCRRLRDAVNLEGRPNVCEPTRLAGMRAVSRSDSPERCNAVASFGVGTCAVFISKSSSAVCGRGRRAQQKSGPKAAFFTSEKRLGRRGAERLDVAGEAALVTGSLVLVDQPACGVAIQHRHHFVVGGLGSGLVLALNGLHHFLHGGAQHGALGVVVLTVLFGLTSALTSLNGVCQGRLQDQQGLRKSRSICAAAVSVNAWTVDRAGRHSLRRGAEPRRCDGFWNAARRTRQPLSKNSTRTQTFSPVRPRP